MSAHDMDPSYASPEAPDPRWGFATRADESAPEFEVDEADNIDDTGEVRESVDGLSWLGVSVMAATTLAIGIAIGVWTAPMLRQAHKPPAEPTAPVANRAEAPVPLQATAPTSAAAPPPEPAAPVARVAIARLEPAPAETRTEQPLDASTNGKRHAGFRKIEPVAPRAPRRVAVANPVAPPTKPEVEHPSPIDELLAASAEAPH